MLKSISNLGKVLSKSEQQTINGGLEPCPDGSKRVFHRKTGIYICAMYQMVSGLA